MAQTQRRSQLNEVQYGEPNWSWTELWIPSATSMAVEYGPNRQLGNWQATTMYIYPPRGTSTCSFIQTTYQKVGGNGYWKWGAYSADSNTTGIPKSIIEYDMGDKDFASWTTLRVAIYHNGESSVGSGNPTNCWRIQYAWKEFGREA